jgi:hypothetical protein
VDQARELDLNATLAVYVYLTGGGKQVAVDAASGKLAIEDLPPGGEGRGDVESGSSDPAASSEPDRHTSDDSKSLSDDPAGDGATVGSDGDSPGHPLELARMLPRRYANAMWNLPFFVFYSGATFFGFWYLLREFAPEANNYYTLAQMTWITMYVVLMYFAIALLPEAFVLGLRRFWPQPTPDQFDVVGGSAAAGLERRLVRRPVQGC